MKILKIRIKKKAQHYEKLNHPTQLRTQIIFEIKNYYKISAVWRVLKIS